jgi:hypothetical protein
MIRLKLYGLFAWLIVIPALATANVWPDWTAWAWLIVSIVAAIEYIVRDYRRA